MRRIIKKNTIAKNIKTVKSKENLKEEGSSFLLRIQPTLAKTAVKWKNHFLTSPSLYSPWWNPLTLLKIRANDQFCELIFSRWNTIKISNLTTLLAARFQYLVAARQWSFIYCPSVKSMFLSRYFSGWQQTKTLSAEASSSSTRTPCLVITLHLYSPTDSCSSQCLPLVLKMWLDLDHRTTTNSKEN